MNSEIRNCQNCKADFNIEPEDFDFYNKVKVPPPTFCPKCRFQRRLSWRNERSFFKNICKKCGKKVLSVYPEDSNITVYCRPCWWSDDWDATDYGVDFDPNKPFLEQVKMLLEKVPIPDLFGLYSTLENSDYTNMVGYLKNCYFVTMSDWSENCSYGSNVYNVKDSYDALILDHSELCYEVVNCRQCYKTIFSVDCESCQNVSFSRNCVGCSDCIGCVNLRNKQYCILNKQYSKEEYLKLAKNYQPTSRSKIKEILEKVDALAIKQPYKYMHERLTQSVSGDYIYNAKNVRDSFMVQEMENSRFCSLVLPGQTNDCYDHTHYGKSTELLYETLQVGNQASKVMFSWFVITGVEDVRYSIWSIGSKNLFGCVGLKKKEYCILNKQYSKEEYERLIPQIIKQMNENPYRDSKGREYKYGEFFPIEMSPFAYNISSAQEIFPLSQQETKNSGYQWKDVDKSEHSISIRSENIPDQRDDITDAISKEVLECRHKGRCDDQCSIAFLVTGNDLTFYRKMGLPLPDLCPNCRHYRRVKQKNPFQLWRRQCMCDYQVYDNESKHNHHPEDRCPNEFETSYSPERKEIIYCEACYQAEVV